MSSSCWRSASTPGRDGSSSRPPPTPAPPPLASIEMHSVGHIDWSFVDRPRRRRRRRPASPGCAIVGPEQGAVHTDLGRRGAPARRLAGAARPLVRGGALRPRGRAAGRARRSRPPARRRRLRAHPDRDSGTRSATARPGPARFLSLSSPQRLDPGAPRRDTFFEPAQDLRAMDADATRPPFGDPTLRLVGHYEGTRRRSRRSGSRTPPAAARRPAPTPRSSPTAGSP